jgi:hypothetical protein
MRSPMDERRKSVNATPGLLVSLRERRASLAAGIEGFEMKTPFLKGLVFGAVVCGVAVGSTAALAGTGIGGVFNIGTSNRTNASTVLSGTTNGQQFRVVNNSRTGTGVTGIGIHTAANEPPLAVDSKTRVNNLNADLLDGQTSAAFVAGGGQIVSARLAPPISDTTATLLAVPNLGVLEATCASSGFQLEWINRTSPSTALDVWVAHDGVVDFVTQAAFNDGNKLARDVQGDELFSEQVGRTGHTATITTAAHWSVTGCVFNAQAITQ